MLYFWLRTHDWEPGALVRNLPFTTQTVDMVISLTVLAYVLQRSGRSFRDIGLRWCSKGLALALPLWLLGELINRVQMPVFFWLGQTFGQPGWHPPDVGAMIHADGIEIATIAGVLLVGFFEELIVRAYLMTEIIARTNRTWLAVVISVAVQTSYHFYQGVPLALSHVFLFTLFAVFYAKTHSILPVAVAHSLVDLDSTWHYGLRQMFPQ